MPETKEMTDKTKTDLEIITGNDSEEVEIRGRKIRVEPVKLKNLPAFSRASVKIFGLFSGTGGQPDFLKIAENMDAVGEVLQAGTGLTAEEVGELDASEALALLSSVVGVNASFFVSGVLPAVQGFTKNLTSALAGRTQSSS